MVLGFRDCVGFGWSRVGGFRVEGFQILGVSGFRE